MSTTSALLASLGTATDFLLYDGPGIAHLEAFGDLEDMAIHEVRDLYDGRRLRLSERDTARLRFHLVRQRWESAHEERLASRLPRTGRYLLRTIDRSL